MVKPSEMELKVLIQGGETNTVELKVAAPRAMEMAERLCGNGPLEGNVNRLKLIKRSMYGRADIDLLKLRVLYHSKKGQDRKDKRNKKQQKSLKNSASSLYATTPEISQVA